MTGDHAVTAQRVDAASTAHKRFAAGKTLARTEFTSDRAFQIRAPVGRQPNGTSAAIRSEFHKGYQSIGDLRKIKDFVGNMIKCDAFMYGR